METTVGLPHSYLKSCPFGSASAKLSTYNVSSVLLFIKAADVQPLIVVSRYTFVLQTSQKPFCTNRNLRGQQHQCKSQIVSCELPNETKLF